MHLTQSAVMNETELRQSIDIIIKPSKTKIMTIDKLKLNLSTSATKSQQVSPRFRGKVTTGTGMDMYDTPIEGGAHNASDFQAMVEQTQIEQSTSLKRKKEKRSKSPKGVMERSSLQYLASGRDKIILKKLSKKSHLKSSRVSPQSSFKDMILGTASPFKH